MMVCLCEEQVLLVLSHLTDLYGVQRAMLREGTIYY